MIRNARITRTELGREDHGIMTFMIFIVFDDGYTHCGIGGYALDRYDRTTETRVFNPKSIEAISKILDVVGVDRWEDLPNKYIRFEDSSYIVTKIGNIIEDKWFDLKEFFSN